MPVIVDEVTAEVAPPERRGVAESNAGSEPPQPSDARRQREQLERIEQRAARVLAN